VALPAPPPPLYDFLPADWQPTPGDVRYARMVGLDPAETAAAFKAAWSGQRPRHLPDWEVAWREWCKWTNGGRTAFLVQ
jgi:hypothetical protein